MTSWEYRGSRVNIAQLNLVDWLNEQGVDGWECVHVRYLNVASAWVLVKRPRRLSDLGIRT